MEVVVGADGGVVEQVSDPPVTRVARCQHKAKLDLFLSLDCAGLEKELLSVDIWSPWYQEDRGLAVPRRRQRRQRHPRRLRGSRLCARQVTDWKGLRELGFLIFRRY